MGRSRQVAESRTRCGNIRRHAQAVSPCSSAATHHAAIDQRKLTSAEKQRVTASSQDVVSELNQRLPIIVRMLDNVQPPRVSLPSRPRARADGPHVELISVLLE